jgi:hypothetical protein
MGGVWMDVDPEVGEEKRTQSVGEDNLLHFDGN